MRPSILLTFLACFASVLVERGIYFLAREALSFSDAANLWLALSFGAFYIVGASSCHLLTRRFGERRVLVVSLLCHVVVLLGMAAWCASATVFVGLGLLSLLSGIKWPVIESYVTAGQTPRGAFRTVGLFNLTWGLAVPMAMAAGGWMIHAYPPLVLLAAAALYVPSALIAGTFPAKPVHLDIDHPERPDARGLARQTALLAFSRWLMLLSYVCLWILAPLSPGVFARLGVATPLASALSGAVDWARFAVFVILYASMWWRGRTGPLVASMVALPVGFFMFILGPDIATALAGLAIAGFGVGMTYFASLYYAMVVKNASVEAGGGHESFIGLGFLLGPVAGLIGEELARVSSSEAVGAAFGVGPFILLCSVAALVAYARRRPLRRD